MGFCLESVFLYFNAYDSFIRKASIKCLERARYADYKQKEKFKLQQIKAEKIAKLKQLEELAEKHKNEKKGTS